MGFRIATNVQSLVAQKSLNTTRQMQDKSYEKLSSGSRIVRAGDDAAGLAISEKLKADIRGTQQAVRNAGDGVSMIQTAEGALNEVSNILIRLRELSVQSASDTVGDTERNFSNLEFQSLVQEIDRISQVTKFNGTNLLNGEGDAKEIQIGTNNNPGYDRLNYDPALTNATVQTIGVEGMSVGTKGEAQENLDKLEDSLNSVNANRANLGALQNRLASTIRNLETKNENLSAANSRIRDADIAQETANLAKTNVLVAAGTSVLAQANSQGASALKLIG